MKKFLSHFFLFFVVFSTVTVLSTLLFLGLRELQNPCQRISDASVTVMNADKTGIGSGTILEHKVRDRLGNHSKILVLLTAYHVIEHNVLDVNVPELIRSEARNPTVTNDGEKFFRAHVVYADKEKDVALCIVTLDSHYSSRISVSYRETYLGQFLYHCGSPKGLPCHNTLMTGIVSHKDRHTFIGCLDQTSVPIHLGCSGGGVFDKYGDLIGFMNIKCDEGISGMTNISTVYWELYEVGLTWLLDGRNIPTVEEINELIAKQIKDRK